MESKGKGVGFQRIRRVTGYLTGDVSFMNNAKRSEVSERVKHETGKTKRCQKG